MSVFDPLDPECGKTIAPPYFFYLIDHPDGKLLYDTGAHRALITDPRSRLGDAADLYDLTLKAGDDVLSQLDMLGVPPDQIQHVVASHLHFDHCGGLEFVPDATVYVQKAELPFAYWPPVYQQGLFIRADFDSVKNWKELDGEYDVFNDGKVIIFPTPGHTPGHQSLLLHLDSRPRILAGDAAYDRDKMKQRRIPGILWSPDAIVASWERIEEYQRRYNAEVIYSHDLHYHENVRVAPDEWYE
jgi:glyoxylase-like metal-dependent hydrolase (beta-lactamase superfamily II)